MASNIPNGYDENGVRSGNGKLEQYSLVIGEKEFQVGEAEFNQIREHLGEPQEVSNCCGEEIVKPSPDGIARCPDCKEMCKVLYLFS